MDQKSLAILRLLSGGGAEKPPSSSAAQSNDENNNMNNFGSLSALNSQIGDFLKKAKDAPAATNMDIEIDEEVFEEGTDDYDTDEESDDDSNDLEFDSETMKFKQNYSSGIEPSAKRRKIGEGSNKLIEVVDENNNAKVNKKDYKNKNNKKDKKNNTNSSSSDDDSSDIDIITFSSDDDNDDDGIDLSKLSEDKKKKLAALFSGQKIEMPSHPAVPTNSANSRKDLLKFENNDQHENDDDEDYEEEEPFDPENPLKGKQIQMNLIAGVLQEDARKLKQQRNGDIVLPTPKEIVFEKKKRKKNQKKLSKLVRALVSTDEYTGEKEQQEEVTK